MAEVEIPRPEELEEQRSRAWSRRVALTTAIYAVVLALASLGGNYAMKEMLLAQQQASDQWAFYQAKAVRQHFYRAQRLQIDVALAETGTLRGAERGRFEALARTFGEEEKRFEAEKREIEGEARKLEHERDRHRHRDPYFDYAEVMLQIAIVSASVAILATSRPVYWFSMALAVVGALLTIDGFTLAVPLPFLAPH